MRVSLLYIAGALVSDPHYEELIDKISYNKTKLIWHSLSLCMYMRVCIHECVSTYVRSNTDDLHLR